ncbi:unnamed protein product [Rhodiola kirilowii]
MYSIKSVTNYSSSTSFQNSISSSNSTAIFSSSSATAYIRCEGLDLLAKAVQYVDGCVIGVPIVQKRVLIRRRRRAAAYAFSDFVVNELFNNSGGGGGSEAETDEMMIKPRISVRIPISKEKRQRRVMAVPLKYKDSLVQPGKRQTR